jgi:parvulin-like peptidyl-prolyl isomerase
VASGESLEDAAQQAGLDFQRSGWITRRGNGFVPGLGAAPELLATAFTLEPGASSPGVFEVDDRFALVQTLEHESPEPEQIDPLVAAKREELLQAKRNERTEAWVNMRRKELTESGDLIVNLAAIQG